MIQTVNVNVAAQPTSGGPESFLVLSQNENGRQIRFRILGDDLPAGCTATFSGTKPDGTVYSASGTIDGNFVLLDEEIQMTAVSGRWDAKLSIAKGTENIMTSLIRVTVVADAVSGDAIPSSSELDGIVAECRSYAEAAKNEAYGSPLTASTAAAMTDIGRVYVYTGSESGMTAGHWYYYDGTAWTDGGVYNAVAVDTDTTLSIAGKAADAKEVGDQLADVKEDLQDISTKAFPSTAKVLLISLLQNAVFTSDQTEIIDALDTALNIGDIVAVTGISLDSSTKTVTAGDTVTITATITPSNATNKGIVWTSSDESVATVNGGVVTGVGSGTAVITAKTVDGGYTATCSVTSTVVNLLDRSKSSVSNYVKRDNGQLASSDTFDATDFIWLEPNTTYYSEGCYLENFYAFYNANKVYVSSPPASVTITSEPDRNYGAHRKGTIVTGSQGYYFRGSYNKAVAYTPYIALTPIE